MPRLQNLAGAGCGQEKPRAPTAIESSDALVAARFQKNFYSNPPADPLAKVGLEMEAEIENPVALFLRQRHWTAVALRDRAKVIGKGANVFGNGANVFGKGAKRPRPRRIAR